MFRLPQQIEFEFVYREILMFYLILPFYHMMQISETFLKNIHIDDIKHVSSWACGGG
jgi:hypothetical protein